MKEYTFQRTDLASRSVAAKDRAAIGEALSESQTIVVDLKNVASISESFADELFGVLVLEKGLAFVTRHLKIRNASESVLKSIAVAMQRRNVAA